jgi:F0F1-type ATP synthase epsilon subunit
MFGLVSRSILPPRPVIWVFCLVEIIEEQGGSKQFFLSGGFATVQPGSVLSINAVEGYPLEDFSAEVGYEERRRRYHG